MFHLAYWLDYLNKILVFIFLENGEKKNIVRPTFII